MAENITTPEEEPAAPAEAAAAIEPSAASETTKAARPKMPGTMRFIVAYLVFDFLVMLMNLVFESRDLVVYSATNVTTWFSIAAGGVLIWMLLSHFKVARPYAFAYIAFQLVSCAFYSIDPTHAADGSGGFRAFSFFATSFPYLLVLLYFLFSKKAKAFLTEPFSAATHPTASLSEELVINRKSWAFWRNIGIYYCFFSLAGHWMESAFCMLIRIGLVQGEVDLNNTMLWRDWFYPFPMEGFAVVLIAILLYPLYKKLLETVKPKGLAYVISLVVNGLVCVAIEYTMGLFVNADLQLWDYSDMPFNLNGMICLQNGVGFAMAASLICWVVYPFLERLFARIPKNVMNLIFVITLVMYAIPQTLYLIDPPL